MFYDIYLNGAFFDNVYFSARVNCKVIKRKLIEDGYPTNIEVGMDI